MSKLYVNSRSRFRPIQIACPVKLPFPIHLEIRLAQLSENAPQFGALKALRPHSSADLQSFLPNMVVGTATELQQLAGQVSVGAIELSSVDHGVIALTYCGEAPLSDVARVVLWQTFGVPVFEIFTGYDNTILGYECELHEGWHLAPGVGFLERDHELMIDAPGISGLQTGLSGFLTGDKCPCAREGPRLLHMQALERPAINLPLSAIA